MQLILGARDGKHKLLMIWLIIGMIEIVLFILGALAFLAAGIIALTNKDTIHQALRDKGFSEETIKLSGALLIAASITYFIASGKEKFVIKEA